MTRARTNADQAHTENVESIPHIVPGVLYPAVAGKLLDGSTSHGATYGVAQSDGRMYYYTDIKGSKPIKDPRIGGHFGSQRYLLSSAQLQTDESASHGAKVYRFEGREWVRGSGGFALQNDTNGIQYEMADGAYIEITGYFSDANIQAFQYTTNRHFTWSVDGGSGTTNTTFRTSTNIGPAAGRYINGAGFQNIGLGATLGIHTLKIATVDQDFRPYAFELIAQDTSSTANKSKIQIPSQSVVSYGKKFTVSGTPHYDPFNGFTSGNLAAVQALIDTDTSLGIANWLHSSTYYRPYNGGRVVKWVDSSGTIKTSVNMMPPNAQNLGGTSITAKANASVANDTYLPTFSGAIDHSQAETAKTFHWREFGNGAQNGGTGASGNKADASMLTTTADVIAYVMDDGLTSLSGVDVDEDTRDLSVNASGDGWHITFIGTGLSFLTSDHYAPMTFGGTDDYDFIIDGVTVKEWTSGQTMQKLQDVCQNLPYGTHIFQMKTNANAGAQYMRLYDVTFHQPKKPPIPEDAVVLADYMLMADFVQVGADGLDKLSKGTRLVSSTRDHFHDYSNGGAGIYFQDATSTRKFGMGMNYSDFTSEQGPQLTYFGEAKAVGHYIGGYTDSATKAIHHFDGATTNVTVSSSFTDSGAETTGLPSAGTVNYYIYATKTTGTMGVQTVKGMGDELGGSSDDYWYHDGFEVVTPIHTSSHYQTFETPFVYELVGGDRNMEQTNLVVTPDGKSWDEVTRDTNYISKNICVQTSNSSGNITADGHIQPIATQWRGQQVTLNEKHNAFQKNWAIGYDRLICLVDGTYNIKFMWYNHSGYHALHLNINGTHTGGHYGRSKEMDQTINGDVCDYFKRGDWFALNSQNDGTVDGAGRNLITIEKVK